MMTDTEARPPVDETGVGVPPSEVPSPPARLRSTATDAEIVLDRPVGLLGRTMGSAYRVRDRSVSRVHAQIEYRGRTLVVSDLDSTSGTFVGETRLQVPTVLTDGATVRFGAVEFTVSHPAGPDGDEDLPRIVTQPRRDREREIARRSPLTPRQQDVLIGMADGLTNAEIAERLGLAPRTVKAYAADIFDRLGRRSRAGAVGEGHRMGLLGEDESPGTRR